ncbi:GTP 3',8-cyclase MoaA [Candidatus Poribacteria bacterium]|nr:GTP 3',8-cyclase MoaA [Candidatus Poribacteria bacterium]
MLDNNDSFGRHINYLRISITDRCNLRCEYCMPEHGIEQLPTSEILTYDEIVKVAEFAVSQGINRIRITGGEPFVRKNFFTLLYRLSKIPGIIDLGITTNGTLLEEYAESIYTIGIKRINISLDTLDSEKFKLITRRDEISKVKKGIVTVLNLGFNPIKLNMVVIRGVNDDEIEDFAHLAREHPLHLRFIGFMPVSIKESWNVEKYISADEIKNKIQNLIPIEKIAGSGPAIYYKIPGGKGTIGFIDCMLEDFCKQCNRLRLTSDGKFRSCLFSDQEIDVKSALRKNCTNDELAEIFSKAIKAKPERHPLFKTMGTLKRTMSKIGG